MYTLRLILKGVIFLATVKGLGGQDELWLLLLDPGYKTAVHHHARLYVEPQFVDKSSRDFDGKEYHTNREYFDLAGEHLTLSKPDQPGDLFFAKNTRKLSEKKPCFKCGNTFTFRQQKDDFQWVNSLSDILSTVPLMGGHTFPEAIELRTDIVEASYKKDAFILARIVVGQGEVRTYTLWDEKGDPLSVDASKISTYDFVKPNSTCNPIRATAVAQSVAIDLSFNSPATFRSRLLADEATLGRNIVLMGQAGELIQVEISSMVHEDMYNDGDFNAFYEVLKNPDYFQYRPLPRECVAPDSGGACSPARP